VKILGVHSLKLPGVHVIRHARFLDQRGYFTEHYRQSDLYTHPLTAFLHNVRFVQSNESFSHRGTVRGLHFQWQPRMGKLVRTLHGHMIDLVLDIRKGSPTLGKIIAHDMPANYAADAGEWIWVPPGFAHGNFFLQETAIEYFCTGEYNPHSEAGICPLADDLDWSLCEPSLRESFLHVAPRTALMSPKDRAGLTLAAWLADAKAEQFVYHDDSQL
jgi:dTDP-4-dehydrorhamnose 3,5-epimerase